jgi:hypothetical protein
MGFKTFTKAVRTSRASQPKQTEKEVEEPKGRAIKEFLKIEF